MPRHEKKGDIMNQNHKIIIKKGVAIAAAAMIGLGTVACGTSSADTKSSEKTAKEYSIKRKELESALTTSSFGTADKNAEKDETVYVNADANGKTTNIIVSDWLKNYKGEDTISDKTNLTKIKNVKGNEKYTKNSDGSITWNAKGNDIFYQGRTSEELPVGVKVSYKLDGKDISPEDLAGKSGKVTIRFDYENNTEKTVNVNGKDIKVKVPFAMISGVILPSDNFKNISVTNGQVVSDSSNSIVVGAALPGLKESLDLDSKKLNELEAADNGLSIPESVEITADTTDFELGMTMTMASCNVLSELGFDDMDNSEAVTTLKDDMDKLTDAMNQLENGSNQLKNGTSTLKKGTGDLKTGTNKLKSGAGDLKSGTSELKSGAGELKSGSGALKSGIEAYTSGADEICAGITGKNGVYNSMAAMKSGVDKLYYGMAEINKNIKSSSISTQNIGNEANELATYLAAFSNGKHINADDASTILYGALQESGIIQKKFTPENISALSQLAAAVQSDPTKAQELQAAQAQITTAITEAVNSKINDVATKYISSPEGKNEVEKEAEGLKQNLAALSTNNPLVSKLVSSLGTNLDSQKDVVVKNVNQTIDTTASGEISKAISQAAGELKKQQHSLSDSEAELIVKAALSRSIKNKLAAGGNASDVLNQTYLTGSDFKAVLTETATDYVIGKNLEATDDNSLYGGLKKLDESINASMPDLLKLYNGAKALSANSSSLLKGAEKLDAGAGSLLTGSYKLDAGAGQLFTGTVQLDRGAGQLDSGAAKLLSGINELSNGLVKFDQEGVSKLSEAYNGDIKEFADRLKAVDDASKDYISFGGLSDGMTGTVKFVIETDGIEADKD